jgi:hypothetical protein
MITSGTEFSLNIVFFFFFSKRGSHAYTMFESGVLCHDFPTMVLLVVNMSLLRDHDASKEQKVTNDH